MNWFTLIALSSRTNLHNVTKHRHSTAAAKRLLPLCDKTSPDSSQNITNKQYLDHFD